jgi:hypothetical protein
MLKYTPFYVSKQEQEGLIFHKLESEGRFIMEDGYQEIT